MQMPVADAHCDFLYSMVNYGQDVRSHQKGQAIHLEGMRQGGVKLQFFAAWIDRQLKTPYLQQCITMIDAYYRMLEENRGALIQLTPEFQPEQNGPIATLLTVEGGEAIEGSLAVLRVLYRLGVRAMTLTWNHNNELASAALKPGKKGLTALGREVIAEMCRLGIAIDVSHLNDAGIDDILSIATRPIFASHSNARALCPSQRALCDDHIRAIAAQGGVVGINFYHKQLVEEGVATIEDIARHILHVVEVGGIGCCAIGSDFDGMGVYPRGLETSAGLPLLLGALKRAGLNDDEIYRIAYGNLRDYIVKFL